MKRILLGLTLVSALVISACGEKKGETAEGGDEKKENKNEGKSGTFYLNNSTSYISWHSWEKDNKENHSHKGKVKIKDGYVAVTNGEVTESSFNIDVLSLFETDLDGDEQQKNYLLGHLASSAFFGIDSAGGHEIPKFVFTSIENGVAKGDLTIAGNTQSIEASVNVSFENDVITITSEPFTIDMTVFGMPYFAQDKDPEAKETTVNPEVEFTIHLTSAQ